MTSIRLHIVRCLALLMLFSIALPALAQGPANCCQPPPVPAPEAACCEPVEAPPESAEICELACYIVCEHPPGVDPFHGLDWHQFQPALQFASLPEPTPPSVVILPKAVTEHAERILPCELELPPEAHPNPPPQLL